MSLILICILFYLIGSFPTAYLLVKFKYKKNLSDEGSGNVGARNTFHVTNSKLYGIIVLLIDFLKGLIPVLWFLKYSETVLNIDIDLVLIPSVFLLLGHNFSVWIKFKGGRGLATGAGMMVAINFSIVIIWLLIYSVLNKLIKNVHISSVIALVILPLPIIFLQGIIFDFNNPLLANITDKFQFLFSFCTSVCIVILMKHIEPILALLKKNN